MGRLGFLEDSTDIGKTLVYPPKAKFEVTRTFSR